MLSLDVVAIVVGTGCGLSAEAVVNGMGTGLDWLTSSGTNRCKYLVFSDY